MGRNQAGVDSRDLRCVHTYAALRVAALRVAALRVAALRCASGTSYSCAALRFAVGRIHLNIHNWTSLQYYCVARPWFFSPVLAFLHCSSSSFLDFQFSVKNLPLSVFPT
jgi:hypothetical protein